MFYGQCGTCGERWELGTAPTCTCKDDDDETMCYRSELDASVKEEREACALLTEQLGSKGYGTLEIAAAIRARGQA